MNELFEYTPKQLQLCFKITQRISKDLQKAGLAPDSMFLVACLLILTSSRPREVDVLVAMVGDFVERLKPLFQKHQEQE